MPFDGSSTAAPAAATRMVFILCVHHLAGAATVLTAGRNRPGDYGGGHAGNFVGQDDYATASAAVRAGNYDAALRRFQQIDARGPAGVPRDQTMARALFLGSQSAESVHLVSLLDHGLLPRGIDELSPTYLANADAKIAAQNAANEAKEAAAAAAEIRRYEASHPIVPDPPGSDARRQCLSTCSVNYSYCTNNNSFGNFAGIATGGLSLGTLMSNSMRNTDCDGDRQSCVARCR